MIENIIFDLGDVFVDLDHEKFKQQLQYLGLENITSNLTGYNQLYEKGLVSTDDFMNYYKDVLKERGFSDEQLIHSWNSILSEFPAHRLIFLENIPDKYRLFLLSNTNELHIDHVKNRFGDEFYSRFVNCFERIYYSFEINLRKPDAEPFQLIITENQLSSSSTLFIDDTLENIEMADKLGIRTWHIEPGKEDVSDLFDVKRDLF